MVFRISSSSKRSVRESWRTTRVCAGVLGGSSGSSRGLSYRGGNSSSRAFGLGRSGGGRGRGFGLGFWLVLRTRRSATALGGGRGGLWLGRGSWRCGRGRSRRRSWRSRSNLVRGQQRPPLSGSSLPSFSSKHLLPRARPTSPSAVEVYAEADAGASQVHHVAFVIRQLEAEVAQGDGASQVHHVVLVSVGFHDITHALLADDLRDDVVAQRADGVRGVGQAAAAEINFRVRHHLHEGVTKGLRSLAALRVLAMLPNPLRGSKYTSLIIL